MTAALKLPSPLDEKRDWTVDDLASLPQDLRYELIDGRLVLTSATGLHQHLCFALVSMLLPHCPQGYLPYIDISLEVDRRNEPRPDVVVMPMALALRSPASIERALLLIEVISPSSRSRDMRAKAKVFAAAGVEHYWIVDPLVKGDVTLTEHRIAADGKYEIATSTDKVFTTDVPYPATIDLPALTEIRESHRRAELP